VLQLTRGLRARSQEISEIDITKDVVSHRLYKQVMSNYNNFVDGMRHVREVQLDLGDISRLLTSGRKLLDLSSKGLTSKGLGLVHASRRYQRAGYLRAALSLINRTFNEEDAMEEHLRKGELAEAVGALRIRGASRVSACRAFADAFVRRGLGARQFSQRVWRRSTATCKS
jgi:hypothetical protein